MVFRGHEITTGTANKGDALITLEITKSDGVKIEITSKVLVKYGQSIEKSVKEILAANLGNARVLIEDHGALDFVIRARLETAIQRFLSEKEY
mgnify:CR=1 FL=1